jgi:phosphoglycerate dehydrogenase-like enzyme
MPLSVHLLSQPDDQALIHLRAALDPSITLTMGSTLPQPARFQILVAGRPKREHIVASPDLRALVIPFAGLPAETRELMMGFPHIAVHNLHHNAEPVAELALALLLSAAKFIVPMARALRANDWTPRYAASPALLLAGRTALILGYGAVGQHVARLCRCLGMNVLTMRRDSAKPSASQCDEVRCVSISELHDWLPQADALVICLPHTPETEGLIGRAELDLLPRQAILVNVGRGEIVDEVALYEALRDGRLYAAGLDVWYRYPANEASRSHTPPAAYPFRELNNVVMSPHRGGLCSITEQLRMQHLAWLLNATARNEAMPNRVDVVAGY